MTSPQVRKLGSHTACTLPFPRQSGPPSWLFADGSPQGRAGGSKVRGPSRVRLQSSWGMGLQLSRLHFKVCTWPPGPRRGHPRVVRLREDPVTLSQECVTTLQRGARAYSHSFSEGNALRTGRQVAPPAPCNRENGASRS